MKYQAFSFREMAIKRFCFMIAYFYFFIFICTNQIFLKYTNCLQHSTKSYYHKYEQRIISYLSTASSKIQAINLSTVKSPPKTDTTKENDIKIEPPQIEKNNNIQKELEEYIEETNDQYMVILYDDPVNKRAFVAAVLMTVFSWSEDMASAVMLRAHTTGFAVTGEWSKDIAEDYWKKLIMNGLVAEVVKSNDMNSMNGKSN